MMVSFSVQAKYQRNAEHGHVIHIVTMASGQYVLELVKAHDAVFGRETVASMAERTGASIAINAGFFQIGQNQDGMPAGTLIINGQIFGYNPHKNSCLISSQGKVSIERVQHPITWHHIKIHRVNQFGAKNQVVLYTSAWGRNTLTPVKGRREWVFGPDHRLVQVNPRGGSDIPHGGCVLSVPDQIEIDVPGDATLNPAELVPLCANQGSAVTGIPMLVQDGQVVEGLNDKKDSFNTSPHARTALGIKANGDMVVVVAEHHYSKPLTEITLGEIRQLLGQNKDKLSAKYGKSPKDVTMDELKEIASEEYSNQGVKGLTIPELAKLMQDLGCVSAINFDGGGSSALWMEGKLINTSIGDQDEALGQLIQRPVSDAVVFRKVD